MRSSLGSNNLVTALHSARLGGFDKIAAYSPRYEAQSNENGTLFAIMRPGVHAARTKRCRGWQTVRSHVAQTAARVANSRWRGVCKVASFGHSRCCKLRTRRIGAAWHVWQSSHTPVR